VKLQNVVIDEYVNFLFHFHWAPIRGEKFREKFGDFFSYVGNTELTRYFDEQGMYFTLFFQFFKNDGTHPIFQNSF